MERDLRVVGASLDAEVSIRARRIEQVAGKVPDRMERARPAGREPERVAGKEGRPEAEGDGQLGGTEPEGLAGIRRGHGRVSLDGPGWLAAGHQRRRRRPLPEQVAQLCPGGERQVERGEHEPVLCRGCDPCLVGAVEGNGRITGRVVGSFEEGGRSGAGREPGGTGARRDEEAPAAQHQPLTLPATVDNGSASAMTCCESVRRSAAVSSL